MAILKTDFYSRALSRVTGFNILLPNDVIMEYIPNKEHYNRKTKTLYLLHGYSGANTDWLYGSSIQELSIKYNLAVVMPSGDNSFYLDGKGTGSAYCQYVGKELVEYVEKTFGLSSNKEDTFIGGYSMGGFGAIHTGLTYPETFGKIIALSSALIIHSVKNIKEDFKDGIANYDYYNTVFGDLEKLEQSVNNPEYLIMKMKEAGVEIPQIYMACGTEDFLIEQNRAFHSFLTRESVEVKYLEDSGVHDWSFWGKQIIEAVQWLFS